MSCVAFAGAIVLSAALGEEWASAIYLLSFWHYYLYGLAFVFRVVPFEVFKRDAMTMKAVALAALAIVYFGQPLDALSLAIIVLGFGLNISAAMVLGADRTYYGQEVGGLPPRRIASFPYSLTAHPMLLGNIAAFAGTLLNADFRARWWPLALVHLVLNVALLAMELRARPRTARTQRGALIALGVLAFAGAVLAGVTGAIAAVFASALFFAYALPRGESGGRPFVIRSAP